MSNVISNAVSLIGGAAIGAAAMYLLDPDQGEGRRKDVAGTATDAVASTRNAVRTTVSGASDSAHSVANTISRYARTLAERVGDHVGDATDTVTDAAGHVADSARSAHAQARKQVGDAVDSARSHAGDLYDQAKATHDDFLDRVSGFAGRARSAGKSAVARAQAAGRRAAGVPEPHPIATATGITAGTLGALALGVGLMYYLDPERGRSRRALLRDKLTSVTRQSGEKVRSYGHHLGNKAHGYAAQARDAIPDQWVEKARAAVSGDSHD